MRTIFEDTNLRAEQEESAKSSGSQYLLVILWGVAIVFLAGTFGVYRWANSRPAPLPPPPPVSLRDLKQVSAAFVQFNTAIREGKWTDAEAMLSTAARKRLTTDGKTLRESLLGKLKDLKMTSADPLPGVDDSDPTIFFQDFNFTFTDEGFTKSETKIINMSLVIENGKIVINGWGDQKPEKKDEKKADAQKG